jgi:WhiB family redox-sensing transcriptional regulator
MAGEPAWYAQAACRGRDPNLWHAAEDAGKSSIAGQRKAHAEALAVCDSCPVVDDCLQYALAQPERHGVWGGLVPAERRRLLRPRPRQRSA